jgi:hypothetical protein
MFEALIYDERDKDSADPASTLGTYDSVILAEKAIVDHLEMFPEQIPHIVKTEVIPSH